MTESQKAWYAVATTNCLVENSLVQALRNLKQVNILSKKAAALSGSKAILYPENEQGLIEYLQQMQANSDTDLANLLKDQDAQLPRHCR